MAASPAPVVTPILVDSIAKTVNVNIEKTIDLPIRKTPPPFLTVGQGYNVWILGGGYSGSVTIDQIDGEWVKATHGDGGNIPATFWIHARAAVWQG